MKKTQEKIDSCLQQAKHTANDVTSVETIGLENMSTTYAIKHRYSANRYEEANPSRMKTENVSALYVSLKSNTNSQLAKNII